MSKVSAQREKATKSPLRIEWRGLNCYFRKGYLTPARTLLIFIYAVVRV